MNHVGFMATLPMSDAMKLSIKVQDQIDLVVRRIAEEYKPEKIILFGSAARGQMGPDSDVDLFIVKDDRQPRHQRNVSVRKVLRDVSYRLPLDVLVYTPKEVEYRLWLGDFFVKRIMKEGRVLYVKQ